MDEIITNAISQLKTKFGETKITVSTIHLVIKECMEYVDHFQCPGTEKKTHTLTLVRGVVIDLIEDPEEERIILEFIDKILETTIDLIILATRGEFNINNKQTQKKVESCTKSLFTIIIAKIMSIVNSKKSRINEERIPEIILPPAQISTEEQNEDM